MVASNGVFVLLLVLAPMPDLHTAVYLWFPHEGRVPHTSLVFRETWDTSDVDRSVHRMNRESEGRCSGKGTEPATATSSPFPGEMR